MGMAVPIYYSAEMVRALPDDGRRYETVHGELLVTPTPSLWHQEIVRRLLVRLDAYLKANPIAHLFFSPADISWSPDVLVQPDLFVADLEEARTLDWSKVRTLLLAVEVLSPSTERHDRCTKRRLYQEVGIPQYWVVDSERRVVEVWTPESRFPTTEREAVAWKLKGATREFLVEIEQLFKPI